MASVALATSIHLPRASSWSRSLRKLWRMSRPCNKRPNNKNNNNNRMIMGSQ